MLAGTGLLAASHSSNLPNVDYKPTPKALPKPKKKAKTKARQLKDPLEVEVDVKEIGRAHV